MSDINSEFTLSSDSDSEDSDYSIQPVTPPSDGATLEHFQEYIKYLQLQKGRLEERNATLNATNNILMSNQPQQSCKCSPGQVPLSTAFLVLLATIATTAAADSDRESEKVIMDLGKKYGLTTEMFMLDDSIFKLPCPDLPADIQGARRYADKSTEKAALVTELHGCIDHTLHPHMLTTHFINKFCAGMQRVCSSYHYALWTVAGSIFNMSPKYFSALYDHMSNQQIMDMIRWVAGKGKDFNVLKAPIIYRDLKFIKVVVGNKMSIYSKSGHGGGPSPYCEMWHLKACTPSLIACSVTSMIFLLSPNQQFPGSGVGATSSISYSTVFQTIKQFFVAQWAHLHVQAIVKNMNSYVFENIDKTAHDADNSDAQAMGIEDCTDSLQRVMANLDDDNSDSDDDNAAQAAPPASIGPSGIYDSAPALPTAPPAPSITVSPSRNSGSHSGPIFPAPQTAPATAPAPRSHPAAIQVAVASVEGVFGEGEDTKVMAQKKGRRKGKAVVASTDVAPRRSSCNGVA
ncbi:uncharacterized protein EDB93DRAFT_1253553 [Suillus bovinus]|uniref:uncharacterized protein n=1 Tax=Suillus bovinus TaxID=48563 RepID=UPI001B85F1C2|nr:uncharacterized protein EDB93DRAFT_1253553 [Suillus bovinus]KAG2137899.1 hypothetical protein EDB93DRAFT_1253553 [Suillus bovinus]